MSNLLSSILLAFNHFFVYAIFFTVPFLLIQICKKKINFVRLGINYAFLLYMMCVIALVFFPLPTMKDATYQSICRLQAIPFHFVSDIVRETPFVWNQPQTYLPAIFDWAVLQVVYNVIMFVPFGMYIRYNFHFNGKKAALSSFLFSCFIEAGQLTGLFFTFSQAYRLCDVDDLITNTFGGIIGYGIIALMEKHIPLLPAIEKFDIAAEARMAFKIKHRIHLDNIQR